MHAELSDLKDTVTEVRVEMSAVQTTMSQLKDNIQTSMSQVSSALLALASVTEKLNANLEEHKMLHGRIDAIKATCETRREDWEEIKDRMMAMELQHSNCMKEKRQALELEMAEAANQQARKQQSLWTKVKEKAVDVVVTAALTFLFYVGYTHIDGFVKFSGKG
jgi:chromosome segregation ATPase